MGLRLLGATSPYGGGIVVPAVKFDVRAITDAAITSGSATLTSATAGFTSAHVGRKVVVWGAGAAGADLVTTISAFNSATSVTLAANAGTTVSAASAYHGSDDSTVIQAAIDQLAVSYGGGIVQLPAGTGFASVILKPGIILQGVGKGHASGGTNTRGTVLQAPPDATQPVIKTGGYGTNLDPYRTGIRDLTIYGGANVGQGTLVAHGPAVRGIELTSSAADTYVSPVPGSPNDPSPIIERVMVTGCRGDVAVYIGTNMRNAWVDKLTVFRCTGVGLQAQCTDGEFSNVQVGVCAVGIRVTASNNLFSNCKAWWCGDSTQSGGTGNGWELKANYTQLTGCQSQDNFGYGLALIANGAHLLGNVVTGFVAGGETNGAVLLQSDNGVHVVVMNHIDVAIIGADRTTIGAAFVLDGAGANTVYENDLAITSLNYLVVSAGYANFKLLNAATMTRNRLRIAGEVAMHDNGDTASGTLSPFVTTASIQRVRLTGNITIGAISNPTTSGQPPPGYIVTWVIVQDGTGSRTVTWDASWVGATAPTATANAITVEKFQNFSTGATPVWQRI